MAKQGVKSSSASKVAALIERRWNRRMSHLLEETYKFNLGLSTHAFKVARNRGRPEPGPYL
jgi:hypothetical protein